MKTIAQTLVLTQIVLGLSLSVAEAQDDKAATVAYRLTERRTTHVDDATEARQLVDRFKKLGCESSLDDHGRHLDVSFRLSVWKSMTLKSEENAHRWEDWLKKNGFETIHAHGEGDDHAGHSHGSLPAGHKHDDGHDHGHGSGEILTYSLSRWETLHARDRGEADQLVAIMKGLGCEVRTDDHAGHSDIVFRCPRQMHLELPSHRVVTGWEKWLQQKGFRTEHAH